MVTVKNLRSNKPSQPWDVKVDRSNKILGNTFYLKDKNNKEERDQVCNAYAAWLEMVIKKCDMKVIDEIVRLYEIHRKYGKLNLWCWCAPERCHADSIKEAVEALLE
jgi:hypothetical protein